tara:strand:- start:106 stop:813 length:708 start_codon:yes stop_codon:yes gene_type:complete
MRHIQSRSEKGMSLIEVIMAIAIGAFILAAAASFIVSISDIWAKRAQRYAFYEHADGVTQFLKTTYNSAQKIENTQNNANNPDAFNPNLTASSDSRVIWKTPMDLNEEPLLYCELNKTTPILTQGDGLPAIGNSIYLHHEDGVLSLLHSKIIQESLESKADLKRTRLSPFVKIVEFVYWDKDSESWVSEIEAMESPDNNQLLLVPNFLKLIFEYNDATIQRIVPIPLPSKNLLLY